MNKTVRRICIFFLLLTIDGETQAKMIIALAERQPNGRSDIKPYEDAKKLSRLFSPFFTPNK